jgi:CheY-like chemotaxis protein
MSATVKNNDRCRDRPFVLFADDDDDILLMLKVSAERRGWCADTASSAREILAKVNNHCSTGGTCYDAIVADVHYFSATEAAQYRMTGISAAAQIKEKYPDLPIVFITAFTSVLMRDEALSVGDGFFSKPFEIHALLDRVQQLIEFTTKALGGPGRRKSTGDLTVPAAIEEVQAEMKAEQERKRAVA